VIASVIKKIRIYTPLISMVSLCVGFTVLMHFVRGYHDMIAVMHDLMGSLLVVFAVIKMIRWQGFVTAFRKYDPVAKKSNMYAVVYPLVELLLGCAYLFHIMPLLTYVFTIILSSINAIGVWKELQKKNPFPCACLGVVFSLPMTWVSLLENFFSILMAGVLLLYA